MSTTTKNAYASYELIDGILHITYAKDVILDLPAALYVVKDRLKMHEGRYFPVLCDIRCIKEINKAARSYLSVEGSTLIKAVAFIVESPVSEMLSEFYLRTSKPPIPNESFNTIESALKFLNQYR
ncbi:hypothetical protein ESY86_17950 [Subsaximicrobium wynnwilliamsii]|uniref:DUF7793 domain-containing protein n=1 Tax=Subsaximicrobium wynnwilliamsii TaxID=291179 RepID=A0A5C6ZC38_9FLAO|nr:hypothetical protein [Subsaximicrobium wynnwilliamsii]TXD81532.1 hypothetical protein ESY87_17950 [Subsaximicrobium wynnwilliamsii]TXD87198.1 hypothetical protein ESY86_17950 [Subsaximicrobium wynnwilliamsii]TXE00892.1 hypothetical protein ESY88_18200 [Subsaximicrobium wynnwilliamsii]